MAGGKNFVHVAAVAQGGGTSRFRAGRRWDAVDDINKALVVAVSDAALRELEADPMIRTKTAKAPAGWDEEADGIVDVPERPGPHPLEAKRLELLALEQEREQLELDSKLDAARKRNDLLRGVKPAAPAAGDDDESKGRGKK